MKLGKIILVVLLLISTIQAKSFVVSEKNEDLLIYENYKNKFADSKYSLHKLFVETALYFRNKPYVASTLEQADKEQLVINLREFDCTTFVESCMALSMTLKSDDQSYESFRNNLQKIRYRGGLIEGYLSRLHYMTDWGYDNEQKGLLKNKTKELQGNTNSKILDFMSAHADSYRQLSNNVELQSKLKKIEKSINEHKVYSFIKKERLAEVESQIQDGDIIVFATSIKGLDYTHTGIAYHQKGILTFIHASSRAKAVIIEPQSLIEYCRKSTKCTGVTVLRLN